MFGLCRKSCASEKPVENGPGFGRQERAGTSVLCDVPRRELTPLREEGDVRPSCTPTPPFPTPRAECAGLSENPMANSCSADRRDAALEFFPGRSEARWAGLRSTREGTLRGAGNVTKSSSSDITPHPAPNV
ncbi:hypothetical protein SKAU_G00024910 [Synaphobranchus kaupii]|uniref:Uncharacterized protein n=1 Tax=Synaphobranchus kaupii TaxID=118154 RepID=A0A9Q1GDJ1_SYNKA|nr:hypothetical protein SKAU_G00024910 [Synaphobranchus kaupii]